MSQSDCVIAIEYYGRFKEQNQKHIKAINGMFNAKWMRFESLCCSWSTHELVIWLSSCRRLCSRKMVSKLVENVESVGAAYAITDDPESTTESVPEPAPESAFYGVESVDEMADETIDWELVEWKLLGRNVRGKHMPHLRERMLQFAGIENMLMIQQIISEINRLVKEHKEFTNLWNSFESRWMQWNVEELIEWMQYETMLIESAKIDWSATSELLKAQNMTGKNLPKMNEVVFPFIAINDSESIEYLMSSIRRLLAEHGQSSVKIEPSVSKPSVSAQNVPKEFLCPITKEIMVEPVIAFDGFSYERTAIVEYLAKHNKSPVTGKEADPAMVAVLIDNNNVKAMIQKFQSENKPSSGSKEQSEGAVETGFI